MLNGAVSYKRKLQIWSFFSADICLILDIIPPCHQTSTSIRRQIEQFFELFETTVLSPTPPPYSGVCVWCPQASSRSWLVSCAPPMTPAQSSYPGVLYHVRDYQNAEPCSREVHHDAKQASNSRPTEARRYPSHACLIAHTRQCWGPF